MKVVETVTSITGNSSSEEGTIITTVSMSTASTNTPQPVVPTSVPLSTVVQIQQPVTITTSTSPIPQLVTTNQIVPQILQVQSATQVQPRGNETLSQV